MCATVRVKALTFVELLTVIAIATIVSFTLFGFAKAGMEHAKGTHCLGNLSSLAKATILYANDHDGLTPPQSFFTTSTQEPDVAGWKRNLIAYKVADAQFYCPSDPFAKTAEIDEAQEHDHRETSYTLGLKLWGLQGGRTPIQLDRVSDSASLVLYHEMGHRVGDPSDPHSRRVTGHGTRLHVVCVDGHAEIRQVPPAKIPKR
jgi:hypothetical protein